MTKQCNIVTHQSCPLCYNSDYHETSRLRLQNSDYMSRGGSNLLFV